MPQGGRGARPFLAPDRDISPVRREDVLEDGQAEAGPASGTRPRGVDTIEALEDSLEVPFGYADALVSDTEFNGIVARAPGGNNHPGLVRAVGDAISQKLANRGDQRALTPRHTAPA